MSNPEYDEIPQSVRDHIEKLRPDIDFIHWDDAAEGWRPDPISGNPVWDVPVEAIFEVERDGVAPCDAGMNHGTLMIELDGELVVDYYVGDWTHGKHPDLHTFER